MKQNDTTKPHTRCRSHINKNNNNTFWYSRPHHIITGSLSTTTQRTSCNTGIIKTFNLCASSLSSLLEHAAAYTSRLWNHAGQVVLPTKFLILFGRLTEITLLAYLLKVEARLLVVVCSLTPRTAQGNNFLRTEGKFGLEWLQEENIPCHGTKHTANWTLHHTLNTVSLHALKWVVFQAYLLLLLKPYHVTILMALQISPRLPTSRPGNSNWTSFSVSWWRI